MGAMKLSLILLLATAAAGLDSSCHQAGFFGRPLPATVTTNFPRHDGLSWVENVASRIMSPGMQSDNIAGSAQVANAKGGPCWPVANRLQEFREKTTEKLRNLNQAQKTAILILAGGIAGATAKSCVAPLERLKLLAQSGECKNGLVATFKTVVKQEGVLGLWRGNTVNVLRMVPNKGVLHATNDLYKDVAKNLALHVPVIAAAGVGAQHFISGSLAGMTSVAATYPLDLIRTSVSSQPQRTHPIILNPLTRARRMAGVIVDGQKIQAGIVKNTWWQTATSVVKNEGVGGLYRGVSPTLIGAFPYEGIKFYCYAKFKEILPHDEDGSQHIGWKLVSGAGAATVAHVVTYPMDTVRRRMQLQGAGGTAQIYKNAVDCAVQMVKKEGPKSLYRGLTATCIRGVPNTGIQFAVYEGLKTLLQLA